MQKGEIYYARVDEFWTKEEKFRYLDSIEKIDDLNWRSIQPDAKHNWLLEGLYSEYDDFIPIGTKEARSTDGIAAYAIFKLYSGGVKTSRDAWAYNFNADVLAENMQKTIDFYNDHVFRWENRKCKDTIINNFVTTQDNKISWSDGLRTYIKRGIFVQFDEQYLRHSIYRPFTASLLYFNKYFNERRYQFACISPTPQIEE